MLGDELARRVLNAGEYRKYVGFHDRAVLGEGVHCLKCGCFVNLPADASNPMVQCPYCRYRFCYRCKTPWHPGVKCGERADVELEEWRKLKGAQKCPGCAKVGSNTARRPCRRRRGLFAFVSVFRARSFVWCCNAPPPTPAAAERVASHTTGRVVV